MTLSATPPAICVTLRHLGEHQALDVDRLGRYPGEGEEPLDRGGDRVRPLPGTGRVGSRTVKRERRVEVAEAPGLNRVVRRLEDDGEIGLAQLRARLEHLRQGALVGRQLLPGEEEEADVQLPLGSGPVEPLRELEHDRETALHVGRAEADDPAVLDSPGQVVLGGDRVQMPGEEHERPPRGPRRRVEEPLAVRVHLAERAPRHRRGDQLGDCGLVPAHRGNVDECERTLGQSSSQSLRPLPEI